MAWFGGGVIGFLLALAAVGGLYFAKVVKIPALSGEEKKPVVTGPSPKEAALTTQLNQAKKDADTLKAKGKELAEEHKQLKKETKNLKSSRQRALANLAAAEKIPANLQKVLKKAGYDANKPTDLDAQVQKLIKDKGQLKTDKDNLTKEKNDLAKAKKAADDKLADAQKSLAKVVDKDRLKGKTLAEGVDLLAADKKKAETMLARLDKLVQLVRAKLKNAKYLKDLKAKDDVVVAALGKAIDNASSPLVTAASQAASTFASAGKGLVDIAGMLYRAGEATARREAELAYYRLREPLVYSPQKMLDQWIPLLEDRDRKDAAEVAKKAARDAKWVLNLDTKATPEVKAKAKYVLGLVARNQGDYTAAKKYLDDAAKVKAPWQQNARGAVKGLTDADAYYQRLAKLQTPLDHDRMLADLTAGQKAAPKSGSLYALSSLVRLDKALLGGKVRANTPGVAEARKDARAAIAAGAKEEGHYALGRIAEELGDLDEAVANYRVAAKYNGRKDLASLYRLALARVLLQGKPGKGAGPKKKGKGGKGKKANSRRPGRKGAAVKHLARAKVYRPGLALRAKSSLSPGAALLVMHALLLAEDDDTEGPGVEQNPNVDEAIKLAEEAIRLGDPRGYLIKGRALTQKAQWTRGMMEYLKGLELIAKQRGNKEMQLALDGLRQILEEHPAFKMPDSVKPPQPLLAEKHYSSGLNQYWCRCYAKAEKEFLEAVKFYGQDARYLYFLGLSRLMQAKPAKVGAAYENFRMARRLENEGSPETTEVNAALERVQGNARRVLDRFRKP
jgi:hypothetical protein